MYKVDEKLLQALLNYLVNKPYIEVKDLIEAIQKSEKLEDLKED